MMARREMGCEDQIFDSGVVTSALLGVAFVSDPIPKDTLQIVLPLITRWEIAVRKDTWNYVLEKMTIYFSNYAR